MRLRLLGIIALAHTIGGCATFTPHAALPVGDEPVRLVVLDTQPGMSDTVIGSFVVPDSQVVVTKPREISRVEGGFGVLGVLAANADGKKDSQALLGGQETALQVGQGERLRRAIEGEATRSGAADRWSFDAASGGKAALELTPFVYIASDAEGRSNLNVVVKAKFTGGQSGGWSSRYVYRAPDAYPLVGPRSLTEADGVLFKRVIDEGYRQIARVMLKDAARTKSGWSPRPARIDGPFFGAGETLALNGEILEETADSVVFNAEGGGLVYGINILPRDQVKIMAVSRK